MNTNKIITVLMIFLSVTGSISAKDYQVSMFGIKSDGVTLNTRSIQRAVDFISEQGGGKLIFYVGRYLTGSIELKSNVTLQIEEGAVLVSVPSIYDYKQIDGKSALILGDGLQNIGISGKGLIEGNEVKLKANAEKQIENGFITGSIDEKLPSLILLKNCDKASIENVTLLNSCKTAVVLDRCKQVKIDRMTVDNKTNKSAALSISGCKDLEVKNCYWDTTVAPLISNGSSQSLLFEQTMTPQGESVSAEK